MVRAFLWRNILIVLVLIALGMLYLTGTPLYVFRVIGAVFLGFSALLFFISTEVEGTWIMKPMGMLIILGIVLILV